MPTQQDGDNFVAQCYEDWRNTIPCHVGQLIDVHDPDTGRLTAIGRVTCLYWSEKDWDWIVLYECSTKNGIVIEETSGAFITKHHGFLARIVK